MAKRKIVWSHRAKIKLFEILEFYIKEIRVRLIPSNSIGLFIKRLNYS